MSIKNIIFKIEAKGNGIVNFDGGNQKDFLKNIKYNKRLTEDGKPTISFPLIDGVGYKHNNITLSKKSFFFDDRGELAYKIKISNDCVRNAMFSEEQVAQTASIISNPILRNNFIASEASLVRGYMLLNKEIKVSLKRKSAIILSDFLQSCNAVSAIELHSKSGAKDNEGEDSDKSEANLWFKESVGDIEYTSKGAIDIEQLQFLSADYMFDRLALDADEFDTYVKFLTKRIPSFNSELNFYTLKNSIIGSTEYGILFDKEVLNHLVKYSLRKLLGLKVRRSKAFAEVTKVKMLLVENPITDNYSTPDEKWIELTSDYIDTLDLDYHFFYEIGESKELVTKPKQKRKK